MAKPLYGREKVVTRVPNRGEPKHLVCNAFLGSLAAKLGQWGPNQKADDFIMPEDNPGNYARTSANDLTALEIDLKDFDFRVFQVNVTNFESIWQENQYSSGISEDGTISNSIKTYPEIVPANSEMNISSNFEHISEQREYYRNTAYCY